MSRVKIPTDFAERFPATPNEALATEYGVHPRTVIGWARRLGLQKDPAYISAVRRATQMARSSESYPTGSDHYAWKGGKPWERYRDPAYIAWRQAVLNRDGYRCQDCGRQCQKYEKGLAAHHLQSYAEHPDLRFDVDNGICLCRQCHMARHGKSYQIEEIACACGCGTMIASRDAYGRPRRFINHHAMRVIPVSEAFRKATTQGTRLTPEHRLKISQGLRSSTKKIGRPPKHQASSILTSTRPDTQAEK